jgi:hypothetical protein
MMESTFEKIVRKTGMKPVSCKCNLCKKQCHAPCMGTPEDMMKIIGAGFQDRVEAIRIDGIEIIRPAFDKEKNSCTFFNDGLCEIHDTGLKPTVGKLSHHSTTAETFNPKKSIVRFVLAEWNNITAEKAETLIQKYIIK